MFPPNHNNFNNKEFSKHALYKEKDIQVIKTVLDLPEKLKMFSQKQY